MTRKSKREIERALQELGDDLDGEPTEIIIRHHRVGTDYEDSELDAGEEEIESEERIWRDDAGEWHADEDTP